jgi:hypothetical protein
VNAPNHLAIFSAALVLANFSGCTVVGITVGAISEGSSNRLKGGTTSRALEFQKGDRVKVVQTDGPPVEGTFLGLDTLTQVERTTWFPNPAMPGQITPPALGDMLVVKRSGFVSAEIRGTLHVMSAKFLELQLADGTIKRIMRENIRRITDPRGIVWEGKQVENFFLTSFVILVSGADIARIPLVRVQHFEKEPGSHTILIWAGVGLAVDILWIRSLQGLKFH